VRCTAIHRIWYEYGTTLGGSKDKQRLVVYSTLLCVIEMDYIIAPLRECLM
jgi:hypothetical protein